METIALKQKRVPIRIRITIPSVLLKFWMAICDIVYAIGFLGRYVWDCITHPLTLPKKVLFFLADALYFTLKFVLENLPAIIVLVIFILGTFVTMLWVSGCIKYLHL